jgi:hypothetical protein
MWMLRLATMIAEYFLLTGRVFSFSHKVRLAGRKLFALCSRKEFLDLEAKRLGNFFALACMQHNAAFCRAKFWNYVCG